MKIIEVRNISKKFEITHQKRDTLKENFIGFLGKGKNKKENVWALKDIDFDVGRGECIGIVGENASGKTTLLKIIGKIMKPSKGHVTVRGKIAPLLTLGVGFDLDLTGKENIYLYGSLMGLTNRQIDEKYEKIVQFSELENFIDTKLKNFSSGMAVRLGFATAINVDADIILVDEVLSVGDGAFQKKCLDKFEELKRKGKTILFVSHGLDSIKKYCNRSIFLHQGQIKSAGETEKVVEIYERHLVSKQLKSHNIGILDKIRQSQSKELPNLEDLKMFGWNLEESYVLECGDPFSLVLKVSNVLPGTIFVVTIISGKKEIMMFSKNFKDGVFKFDLESLPLDEENYEISVGILGIGSIIGSQKFKILVKGDIKTNTYDNITRIFMENPITLDKEILSFGHNCENVLEDLDKGKTLMSFKTIEEANRDSEKGALFINKKLVFKGTPEEVIEKYKKRIYDSTVRKIIESQI